MLFRTSNRDTDRFVERPTAGASAFDADIDADGGIGVPVPNAGTVLGKLGLGDDQC
jgi:hypothetical protein